MTDKTEERIPTILLEDLLAQLNGLPDGTRIGFSGLNFHQAKWRGDTMINIEFNEVVHRNLNGDLVVVDLERPH